jgi:hypothetical protein
VRILFALSSPEYLRYYDTTIEALAARGHDVVVAAAIVRDGKPVRFDGFGAGSPRITVAGLVPARGDAWTRLAAGVRGTMDFARYLHPQLSGARVLRARMKRQALPRLLRWLDLVPSMPPAALARVMGGLAAIERAIPAGAAVTAFLDEHAPDLVLVSPLIEAASEQVDIVKAARARGVRVGACIASWDNLTNKGDLRVPVDFVVVWNEAQKREAVELHRVRAEDVIVTGAQLFDRWFDREPSRGRDAFCRMAGLPPGKPFVLFVGSSVFIARAEVEVPFVQRWIRALRESSDPAVRDVAVLVRPHPYNGAGWARADLSGLGDVAVWPGGRYNPVDEAHRAGFFDSMFHSDAVVGINTSAMIEAAIVGRPVLTLQDPAFAGTQDGTLHFRHLLPEQGGFLRVAPSMDEHVRQLAAVLRDPASARAELARFVGSFIRPHGLDRPALPVVVQAVERQGRLGATQHPRESALLRLGRVALRPLASLANVLPEDGSRKERVGRRLRERWRKAARGRVRKRRAPGRPAPLAPAAVAVTLPLVAATALVLVFAVSEMAGEAPFTYSRPRNIAEAAGMGIGAEVLRRLKAGEDPQRLFDVRRTLISSEITRVTALEAATWSRRVEMVRMLDRRRLIDDPATRRHLTCLAADIEAADIVALLGPEHAASCEPGAAVRRVAARSVQER